MNSIALKICNHCGEDCKADYVVFEDKNFCCSGCKTVYEILNENGLCEYYTLEDNPGKRPSGISKDKWAWLDDKSITKGLLRFEGDNYSIVNLQIPGIHCISCIYLLENLHKIQSGVISSEVNFPKKEITIKYATNEISLRKIVELLSHLGYSPSINMEDGEKHKSKESDKTIIYKLGVAGFCFGNIMLLSLPEYFDFKEALSSNFIFLFRSLSIILSIPVLTYSARDYFIGAWYAIRTLKINMEFPLALGIGGLAIQSLYNIASGVSGGYFDSLTGLVFMLLVGKFFQKRTIDSLNFERDYKAYFPLAILRITNGKEEGVKVAELAKNDLILIHSEEIIPADSLLLENKALIDYSFVTGESDPVECKKGKQIYAGGRNKGGNIRLQVLQKVNQSYLTKLWNADTFKKENKSGAHEWSNQIATYFTGVVIYVAILTAAYWYMFNPSMIVKAVTSVLIVACPCVMALSVPFVFGSVLRIFSKNGIYVKNGDAIEKLAKCNTIIFDKTGTLTYSNKTEMVYKGESLLKYEQEIIASVVNNSTHPVSRGIKELLKETNVSLPIENFHEETGLGLEANVQGNEIRIGKESFVQNHPDFHHNSPDTYISLNGNLKGRFVLRHKFREEVPQIFKTLLKEFKVYLLSGDNGKDLGEISKYLPVKNMHFFQSPESKMQFVNSLKKSGNKVIMIGDGLNDSGALKASNFGITLTDDLQSFTPASDAILDAEHFSKLPQFVKMSKKAGGIIYGSIFFSLVYNAFGLSFAMRGDLHPWVAALLMPVSSITVVIYTQLLVRRAARKLKLKV